MYNYNIDICLKLSYVAGTHPQKGYGFLQIFLYMTNIILGASVIFLIICQFFTNESMTSSQITDAAAALMLYSHAIIKSTFMFVRKRKILNLLNNMNEKFWKMDDYIKNDEQAHKYYKTFKLSFNSIIIMHMINASGFLLIIFLTKFQELIFQCYVPDFVSIYGLTLQQLSTCMMTILFPVMAMDVTFLSILRLTQIQFRILNLKLSEIFDSKEDSTDDEDLNRNIRTCTDHHDFLLWYSKQISEIFSILLFLFVIIIVLSMCLEMYVLSVEVEPEQLRKAVVYTLTGCFEFMICYCYPCQNLIDEIRATSDSIYCSRWYNHLEHGKAIQMIIMKSQRSSWIKAGGFVDMSLQTGLATLKTMVSYSMFLKNLSANEHVSETTSQ